MFLFLICSYDRRMPEVRTHGFSVSAISFNYDYQRSTLKRAGRGEELTEPESEHKHSYFTEMLFALLIISKKISS